MSEENKERTTSDEGTAGEVKPIIHIDRELPNLSDNNYFEKDWHGSAKSEEAYNRGWDKVDGKIHEIFDKGHTGIPPQKPIEKNDEKK